MSIFHDHGWRHATDPVRVVDLAETALRAFGGALTREQAALLLTMWRYRGDLTTADRTAALARFPSGDARDRAS